MLSAHPIIFKGGKVIWLIDSPDVTDIRFGKTLTRNIMAFEPMQLDDFC